MTIELGLSIVIPNHNYANYVGAAIESALEVRWPKVEVIVVDDGSTDASLEVIEAFGDRITAIRQPNAGQMPSCVNGFRRSRGDVIIFLDSDDRLHPDVMSEIATAWDGKASKYQFQMRVIDAGGNATGNVLPQYFCVPSPHDIRDWMTIAGAYPSPPGSGNAYPRWFVERVFGFQSDFVDRAPDSYLLSAAPACGDVVTISKPLADYRVHGLNHGAFLELDDTRFSREIDLTRRRYRFFFEMAESEGVQASVAALDRNLTHISLRAASYRLRPDIHPIEGDSSVQILRDAVRAYATPQGFSGAQRASLFLWIVSVLMSPPQLKRSIVASRFVATRRSQWLKFVLRLLRVAR